MNLDRPSVAKGHLATLLALLCVVFSCGGGGSSAPSSPTTLAQPAGIANGCPSLTTPVSRPGDSIGGDNYQTFARPFFATWCARCHSSALTPEARSGAPEGLNWDVEASVRANLDRIRTQVGVLNTMPLTDPKPSCDERQRLIRWIDAGAP